MKKMLKVVFVAILAIAIASPAMAEIKVNGYLRTIMQADNVDAGGAKDGKTASEVDGRMRALITNQLTDNVKWVYYGEVDTVWGVGVDKALGAGDDGGDVYSAGGGGNLGADGYNLQTKNVYMNFKTGMLDATVGVQGFNPGFDGFLLNHDAAGVKAVMALSDTFSLTGHYSKFDEGSKTKADDRDYYALVPSLKLADGAKLNFLLAYVDDNRGGLQAKDDYQYLGAEFKGKAGGIGLNAWAMYEMGTIDADAVAEKDVAAYAASVQAVFGPAAVRMTYATGDDASDATESTKFNYDIGGGYYMYAENLMIFFTDAYYMNLGSTNFDKKGNGLMALTAKYDAKLGGDMYLKLGAGYFQCAEDQTAGAGIGESDLGYEIAARLGTKVAEKVDVSLNAAYAGIGDAIDPNGDDLFKVNVMLNLPF